MWSNERNLRPPLSLDISPFFEDIIMTVNDFHFTIWKHDVKIRKYNLILILKG